MLGVALILALTVWGSTLDGRSQIQTSKVDSPTERNTNL